MTTWTITYEVRQLGGIEWKPEKLTFTDLSRAEFEHDFRLKYPGVYRNVSEPIKEESK